MTTKPPNALFPVCAMLICFVAYATEGLWMTNYDARKATNTTLFITNTLGTNTWYIWTNNVFVEGMVVESTVSNYIGNLAVKRFYMTGVRWIPGNPRFLDDNGTFYLPNIQFGLHPNGTVVWRTNETSL